MKTARVRVRLHNDILPAASAWAGSDALGLPLAIIRSEYTRNVWPFSTDQSVQLFEGRKPDDRRPAADYMYLIPAFVSAAGPYTIHR